MDRKDVITDIMTNSAGITQVKLIHEPSGLYITRLGSKERVLSHKNREHLYCLLEDKIIKTRVKYELLKV